MDFRNIVITLGLATAAVLATGCASQPASSPAPAATASVPAPAAAAATEADAASNMEKKFQDAARSYKKVEKDGKTLYCKREKVIGTTIPSMQCLTEIQLRNQVENTEELRRKMRNSTGGCVQTGGCTGG
ncbi:MAG TPA: hypothetical protein VMF52_09815 [Steroidobacteraceae bacterium]|nr:hypothetical protein [Steroidobacteraceae bacterium]